MPGAPDPEYVLARTALLDVLEALGDQRPAVILVGAQAIYLHTGAAELAVAEFTTDGDIAIDPSALQPKPKLGEALERAGFVAHPSEVGRWQTTRHLDEVPVTIPVDLLVPEAVGGPGRRGARLGEHGKTTARKARGLEPVLVDRMVMPITALDSIDPRSFNVYVAGPAALLVAKLHKIGERASVTGRAIDKDALDVLRLLRAVSTERLTTDLHRLLGDSTSSTVTDRALELLRYFFSSPRGRGSAMAASAAAPLESESTIRASCAALSTDLLHALSARRR